MPAGSLTPLLALAGRSVWFQASAIIVGTFILEDAATVAAAMQVENGAISWWLSLVSLYAGIVLGDLGLYGLGRLSARVPWIARYLPPQRQETIRAWIGGRIFKVVLVSRFLPGLRLPTYTTCGFVGADLRQFTSAALAATACWTSLLFLASLRIGHFLIGHLGAWRWAGVAGFAGFIMVAGRAAAAGVQRETIVPSDTGLAGPVAVVERRDRVLSFFEFWPDWLFYAPVVAHWVLLGLRYRDFSLPTAANPRITTGGLCGESKLSILGQVGLRGNDAAAQALVAPACGVVARPDGSAAAEAAMEAFGLHYPVVVKPDIGCNGTGVRLLRDRAALAAYLEAFPRGETVVLQRYVAEPNEAGIFYIRHPDEASGRITSLTLKQPPAVVGDGRSTLRALILADERAGRVPHLYLDRLGRRLDTVPAQGEQVQLVFVGNHCKGSIFRDGTALVTPALTGAIDRLARSMPDFHFGRIDVRFGSIAALRQGTGFQVIEINGAGSEATHIWDPATRLLDAWRTQFFHYGMAFRIGAANRRRGFSSSGLRMMWREWKNQRRLMAMYPMND
jgi:membrane protein DedA with SNARE-associated domain